MYLSIHMWIVSLLKCYQCCFFVFLFVALLSLLYLSLLCVHSIFLFFGFISLILIFFSTICQTHSEWFVLGSIGNYFKRYWFVSLERVYAAFLLFRLNSECWEWVLDAQTKSVDPIRFSFFFFFLWIRFYLINSQMDTCCFLVSLPSYNCVSMYPNCVGCCRCRKINLCTCSA